MNASSLPTLATYGEIIEHIAREFFSDCYVWAEPHWLENAISVFVIVMTILYVYIVIVILCNFRQLKNAFYICAISLSLGDLVVLISSIREGRTQSCVLQQIPARHLAWQTIGTFGMDSRLTNNLVLAITRCAAIFSMQSDLSWHVATIGVCLSCVWTIAMTVCSHFGLMQSIWFEEDGYHDKFNFPFLHIRLAILILCTVGTFAVYCGVFGKTFQLHSTANKTRYRREVLLFLQCLLIFIDELAFLYATFWFGNNYLHWGTAEQNALINYTVRPLSTGITPVIYLLFSTEIRRMALGVFPIKSTRRLFKIRSTRSPATLTINVR